MTDAVAIIACNTNPETAKDGRALMSSDFNQNFGGCDHDFLPAGKAKYIRVPARGVNDFRALLADPEKHWKPEYSAYEIAHEPVSQPLNY